LNRVGLPDTDVDMLVIVTPLGVPHLYHLTRINSYFPIQATLLFETSQPGDQVILRLATIGLQTEESA